MRKMLVGALSLCLCEAVLANSDFEVMWSDGDTHYVLIDLMSNTDLLLQLDDDNLYFRPTREICGNADCTTRFYLSRSIAPKNAKEAEAIGKQGMVGEYRMSGGSPIRISNLKAERRDAAVASASCVKEVFNNYCLGGTVSDLPKPLHRDTSGGSDIRLFDDDIGVFVYQDKIAEVRRIYEDMSWIKYDDITFKLSDLYGSPDDYSSYPGYADDRSSRSTAIRIGEAQAVRAWDQGEWSIRWSWFENNGLLIYEHEALSEAMESGLNKEGF
jgi:hypothetical protein